MEHIVQFAIGIDDEAIVDRIQSNAEKVITEKLHKQVARCIFQSNYRGETFDRLNDVAEQVLLRWLDSHKEELVKLASEVLADKMARTKAVKTAINNVVEG